MTEGLLGGCTGRVGEELYAESNYRNARNLEGQREKGYKMQREIGRFRSLQDVNMKQGYHGITIGGPH